MAEIEPIQFSEWLQLRCGRFTASENWKLFENSRTKGQLFGKTAITYIHQKAAEQLTLTVRPELHAAATDWGSEYEWNAYRFYEEKTGYKGEYYGKHNPRFFEVGEFLGYSPDYIFKNLVADFKCPFNSAEHLLNLKLKTQDEFKDLRWEYYCQLQTTMYHHNLEQGDFVSYDERYIEDRFKMKILTIKPDTAWIEEYLIRTEAAITLMNNIIEELKN